VNRLEEAPTRRPKRGGRRCVGGWQHGEDEDKERVVVVVMRWQQGEDEDVEGVMVVV
jgi:hypothetical protein